MRINKSYIGIFFVFFCCQFFLFPQEVMANTSSKTVKIHVVDKNDGTPLAFAHLHSSDGRGFVMTDSLGMVFLDVSLETEYEIFYLGYHPQKIRVSVGSPSSLVVKMELNEQELAAVEVVENRRDRGNPLTLRTLDKELLARQSDQSLAAVLSSVGGVRMMSTGALVAKPIVEGMSGSRIAIIHNSSKLSGQHWGDDHAPEIGVPSYAHVSVAKGANGVRYGANAMSGVVVVDTELSPLNMRLKGSAQVSYSSNGRGIGVASYYENKWKNLGYRFSAKLMKAGDYQTASYLITNTASRLADIQADVAYVLNKWKLGGHFSFYRAESGIYRGVQIGNLQDLLARYELGSPPEYLLEEPFSYKIEYPKQLVQHYTGNIFANYQLSPTGLLSFRYAFQKDYRREYSVRRANYVGVPDFAFRLYSHQLSASYRQLWADAYKLEAGVSTEFKNNLTDSGTGSVPLIPNYTMYDVGTFLLGHYFASSDLSLEGGMRFDFQQSDAIGYNFQGNMYGGVLRYFSTSGSLGGRYKMTPIQELNANIGLAWRAPEVNELYSQGIHHGEAVYKQGDTSLKTEKGLKFSVGYEALFAKDKVKVQAHAFANHVFDYIYAAPRYITVNGVRQPEIFQAINGVFAKYYYQQSTAFFAGGDVAADVHLPAGFLLGIRGEWIRAKNIDTKGFLPNIPADRYEVCIGYDKNWGKNNLKVDLRYTMVAKQTRSDQQIDLVPDTPPAYQLLGGGLVCQFPFKRHQRMELYLRADNITNRLYKDYNNRLRYFLHDRGRNITVGMRYDF